MLTETAATAGVKIITESVLMCRGVIAVIQALVALVTDPEPEHPLRADLAEEYTKDRKKFMKNAEEFTKKYGEKRPDA